MIIAPAPGATLRPRDPLVWHGVITLGFALLVGWHLGIPSKMYFDEIHYVPAARALWAENSANPEHPLFAKTLIAAAIALLGDRPAVWRLPSAVMGVVGLFAFGRALWWTGHRRVASIAGMLLLASDFMWFIQSRIAMLDMVMAGLGMVALWMLAAALTQPPGAGRQRWRLAVAGVALGLAMGAKWSILPVWAAAGVALVLWRVIAARRRGLAGPMPLPLSGLSLAEIVFWLGSVPLAVYWATFWPAFHYHRDAVDPLAFVEWHRYMLALQASVTKHHPYQSVWYQWVVNWRSIWYLYEVVDGAQRGIVLIGNPLTMLAGLPALLWCAWAGFARRRWDAAAVVLLYAASLGLWVVGHKPVQFYYHYLLPGTFLIAALALVIDALWQASTRWRYEAAGLIVLALAVFGWFWPILSAQPLHHGPMSFQDWMWMASWQ